MMTLRYSSDDLGAMDDDQLRACLRRIHGDVENPVREQRACFERIEWEKKQIDRLAIQVLQFEEERDMCVNELFRRGLRPDIRYIGADYNPPHEDGPDNMNNVQNLALQRPLSYVKEPHPETLQSSSILTHDGNTSADPHQSASVQTLPVPGYLANPALSDTTNTAASDRDDLSNPEPLPTYLLDASNINRYNVHGGNEPDWDMSLFAPSAPLLTSTQSNSWTSSATFNQNLDNGNPLLQLTSVLGPSAGSLDNDAASQSAAPAYEPHTPGSQLDQTFRMHQCSLLNDVEAKDNNFDNSLHSGVFGKTGDKLELLCGIGRPLLPGSALRLSPSHQQASERDDTTGQANDPAVLQPQPLPLSHGAYNIQTPPDSLKIFRWDASANACVEHPVDFSIQDKWDQMQTPQTPKLEQPYLASLLAGYSSCLEDPFVSGNSPTDSSQFNMLLVKHPQAAAVMPTPLSPLAHKTARNGLNHIPPLGQAAQRPGHHSANTLYVHEPTEQSGMPKWSPLNIPGQAKYHGCGAVSFACVCNQPDFAEDMIQCSNTSVHDPSGGAGGGWWHLSCAGLTGGKGESLRDPNDGSEWYCWQCQPGSAHQRKDPRSPWTDHEKRALLSLILLKEVKGWRQCGDLWNYFEHCLRHDFNIIREASACRLQLQHNIIGRRSQPDAKIDKTYAALFTAWEKLDILANIRNRNSNQRNLEHQAQPPSVPNWAPLHPDRATTSSLSSSPSAEIGAAERKAPIDHIRVTPPNMNNPVAPASTEQLRRLPIDLLSPQSAPVETIHHSIFDPSTPPQQKRKASTTSDGNSTPTTKKARLNTVTKLEK